MKQNKILWICYLRQSGWFNFISFTLDFLVSLWININVSINFDEFKQYILLSTVYSLFFDSIILFFFKINTQISRKFRYNIMSLVSKNILLISFYYTVPFINIDMFHSIQWTYEKRKIQLFKTAKNNTGNKYRKRFTNCW